MIDKTQFFVINLPHRIDRKELFERSLRQKNLCSLSYNWVAGVYDQDFGGLGCAKSHLLALTKFLTESDREYVGVLEDDFQFRIDHKELLGQLARINAHAVNWDVILLSGVATKGIRLAQQQSGTQIIRVLESQTAAGYITHRRYVSRLIELFSKAIYGMEQYKGSHPRSVFYHLYAIDQVWKSLQKFDTWIGTVPMLGEQQPSFSDIEKSKVDYSSVQT